MKTKINRGRSHGGLWTNEKEEKNAVNDNSSNVIKSEVDQSESKLLECKVVFFSSKSLLKKLVLEFLKLLLSNYVH